jgi:hypothetical protein
MPLKVENEPALVRDEYSKAIINTDSSGYNNYVEQRGRLRQQQEKLDLLASEVSELKQIVFALLKDK